MMENSFWRRFDKAHDATLGTRSAHRSTGPRRHAACHDREWLHQARAAYEGR
jgi:hypothetical protein